MPALVWGSLATLLKWWISVYGNINDSLALSMRQPIRLYVNAPLSTGQDVPATPAHAHYLGSVMRQGVGDRVLLFNGIDGEWSARIALLRKERATFAIERQTRPSAPESDLWLLFAPLKRDATDLLVQKATELGVSCLVPVLTERTNSNRVNLSRLVAIATEAAEQSERLTVPSIWTPQNLQDMLHSWPSGRVLEVAVERSSGRPLGNPQGPAALLIGPEGGFTRSEVDLLVRHPFVQVASLGPRILRAETAAIVGLALLQATSGG